MSTIASPPPPRQRHRARHFRLVAPNAADTPCLARDHVSYLLQREELPELVDTARLLTTELVTNVHRHTRVTVLSVTTTFRLGRVRVAVIDGWPEGVTRIRPAADPPDLDSDGGRGLALVDQLAVRWGVILHGGVRPTAKSVFFVLAHPSAPSSPPSGRERSGGDFVPR